MIQAIEQIERGAEIPGQMDQLKGQLIEAGFSSVDYAAVADAVSLAVVDRVGSSPARLLVAARIGGTRLIDNRAIAARK